MLLRAIDWRRPPRQITRLHSASATQKGTKKPCHGLTPLLIHCMTNDFLTGTSVSHGPREGRVLVLMEITVTLWGISALYACSWPASRPCELQLAAPQLQLPAGASLSAPRAVSRRRTRAKQPPPSLSARACAFRYARGGKGGQHDPIIDALRCPTLRPPCRHGIIYAILPPSTYQPIAVAWLFILHSRHYILMSNDFNVV